MNNYEDLARIYEKIREYNQAYIEYLHARKKDGYFYGVVLYKDTEESLIKKAIYDNKGIEISEVIKTTSLINKKYLQELWEDRYKGKEQLEKLLEDKLFSFDWGLK